MTSGMGRGGVTLTIALALVLSIVALEFDVSHPLTISTGLCLPAPTMWSLPHIAAWSVNLTLMLASSAALFFLNKAYSIVPGSSSILPGIFLLMGASIPWISNTLTSSSILCLSMACIIALLFSVFRSNNATQEMFVIATIISLGSMIQYAFLMMIVPIIVIAVMFKCLRFKELIALGLGIVAPYWVALGLGIIDIQDLKIPRLANIFSGVIPPSLLFAGLLNVAFTAVISIILGLYNAVKLYAGNTRRRLFNMAFNIIGIASIVCMVIDYNNLSAYLLTFYMSAALQYADLFALWNIRHEWIWTLALCLIYISFFTLSILRV